MEKEIALSKFRLTKEQLESVKNMLDRCESPQELVTKFEREFAKYVGSKYAIAVNSGTSALHLALLASNIERTSEVIIPDFTFPATGNVVLHIGARPVLADIDPARFNVTASNINSVMGDDVACIVPVHQFGLPAPLEEIGEIAERRGIQLLEDAAGALGATYHLRRVGSQGLCCFSLHSRKIVTTGEGGVIVTSDSEIAERARALRSHGIAIPDSGVDGGYVRPQFHAPGFNYRLSVYSAAVGLTQLPAIDRMVQIRNRLAETYEHLISDYGVPVGCPYVPDGCEHAFQSYVVRCESERARNLAMKVLARAGIQTSIGSYSLSLLPWFQGNCANGQEASRTTLALPIHEELTAAGVDRVVQTLRKALS
jgi:dTDP-4-amino-4,6-dideoxygalactose transaminase